MSRLSRGLAAAVLVVAIAVAAVGSSLAAPRVGIAEQPLVRAAGNLLELRRPVNALAADGRTVAFVFCRQLIGAWQPGMTHAFAFAGNGQWACPPPASPATVLSLATAGGRVAWAIDTGGNTIDDAVYSASIRAPSTLITEAHLIHCCRAAPADQPDQDRLGDVVGRGGLLLFVSRVKCGDAGAPPCPQGGKPAIVNSTVWKVLGPGPAGRCPGGSGPCESFASSSAAIAPVSVDTGRVALQEPHGTIAILSTAGDVQATLRLSRFDENGALLTAGQLVVLSRGHVRIVNATNGHLLHDWRLPTVSSAGVCGLPPCPAVALRLLDAAHGMVAYILNGRLWLLRVSDGRRAALGRATDARFAARGLFVSSTVAGSWPGRIRFTAWSQLPIFG